MENSTEPSWEDTTVRDTIPAPAQEALEELWSRLDRCLPLSAPELDRLIASAEVGLPLLRARGWESATQETVASLRELYALRNAIHNQDRTVHSDN